MSSRETEVTKSEQWIRANAEQLRDQYEGKTIIVIQEKVVKVFDGTPLLKVLDEYVDSHFPDEEWSYLHFGPEVPWLRFFVVPE